MTGVKELQNAPAKEYHPCWKVIVLCGHLHHTARLHWKLFFTIQPLFSCLERSPALHGQFLLQSLMTAQDRFYCIPPWKYCKHKYCHSHCQGRHMTFTASFPTLVHTHYWKAEWLFRTENKCIFEVECATILGLFRLIYRCIVNKIFQHNYKNSCFERTPACWRQIVLKFNFPILSQHFTYCFERTPSFYGQVTLKKKKKKIGVHPKHDLLYLCTLLT